MARHRAVLALTALSVSVAVAGIIATGGPAQGRAERRDQVRAQDLSEIQMLLTCKAQQAGRVGTDPTPIEACPMTPRLADPFTGAPYRIDLVPPDSLRLCAGFELPAPDQPFSPDESGCILQRISVS